MGLLLVVVGRPVFTDDVWWHLALGGAYAAQGPWLSGDPLLFTAPGAPAPASWLADLVLYAIHAVGGFPALRLVHVTLVCAIAALTWSLLARASRSRALANLGTAIFLVMATYRLVQLRPHLFTILATLLLYRLLFEPGRAPQPHRAALAVMLLALWTNLHAGFVLGPVLIATALVWLAIAAARKPREPGAFTSARIRILVVALVLGSLATLVNPAGIDPHLAYWISGQETPSLARVGDEWSRPNLFAFPVSPTQPGALSWFGLWTCLIATIASAIAVFRRNQRDPTTYALVGLAGLSLCAMMMAVRFSWLGVFPLLLAATSIAGSTRDRQLPVRLGCAAAVVLLLPLYLYVGDWQNLARGLSTNYAQDYAASRYNAHAVWWLDDVDASGHLFAEYSDSGFIGYWLAPQIRTFVNGSLNVRRDAIDANLPIRQRRGARPGERFVDLLDRQGVDLFLGIRLPRPKPGTSPWFYTTAHLEGEAGWIRVFRNLDSAVYVRNLPRNQANLAHISSYYHERGIAFDPQRGFDPAVAITQSLAWSIEHGLVPHYFAELRNTTNDRSSPLRLKSLAMLAEVYAALGLYELAIDIDRELLHSRPAANASHRRVVWSLLRLGRHDEARRHANVFAAHNPADALSRQVISLARATGSARFEAEELASRIARLPVFDPTQAARLRGAIQRPEVR